VKWEREDMTRRASSDAIAIAAATMIVPPLEAGLKAAAFGGPLRGSGP
jgi:hypothetical protein